jgi:hypothetical protein
MSTIRTARPIGQKNIADQLDDASADFLLIKSCRDACAKICAWDRALAACVSPERDSGKGRV